MLITSLIERISEYIIVTIQEQKSTNIYQFDWTYFVHVK